MEAKKADAIKRATNAIRNSDTLDEAAEAYGQKLDVFLKAAKRYNLRDELLAKFTGGKDILAYRAEQRTQALVEDADWLARTGEHPLNAAKRLGFNSVHALERRLERAGRYDLMTRLFANDGMGLLGEQGWRRP